MVASKATTRRITIQRRTFLSFGLQQNLFRKMPVPMQPSCIPSHHPSGIMDKPAPSICVFCGSSFGKDPAYRDAARAIGAGVAALGGRLVFGGGGLGLMGDVAKAALAGGAEIQGIMPAFLQALEPGVSPQEKLIITPHMQERKALMLTMADAFVILPGGLGTFDEFFEVTTEAQLGAHAKPIILVNIGGYFDTLDTLMRHMVEAGFAKEHVLTLYRMTDNAEAALALLHQALAPSR